MQKEVLIRFAKVNWILLLILLFGSLSWSVPLVKSGITYDYGIGFWGANGHDGVWHIALAKSLSRGSWDMPTFSGQPLQNYHVGFDLLLSIVHTITRIPIETLYFQVFPPVISLLVGVLTYIFVYEWKKKPNVALWSTFFVYFGGSLGWLVNLLKIGRLGGESMFWSQQAVSSLVNPPFALSLVFLLAGLVVLLRGNGLIKIVSASIICGFLIQVKAYAGALALGGLFVAGLYSLVKERRKDLLIIAIIAAGISVLLFLPLNKGAGGLLVLQPFWFIENMMILTDRLGWVRFGEAMLNYKSGNVLVKLFPAYLIAFMIFLVGNIGTRIASIFYIFKKHIFPKTVDYMDVLVTSIIFAGIVIPTFFLQKGTPWNTIQFMYYSLFFLSILAGISISEISKSFSKQKRNIFVFALVIFTLPTTIATLVTDYLPNRPPSYISKAELEALSFLSKEPEGVVFTFPFDEYKSVELAKVQPNRPLYRYVSTAYVSAFSNKPVFLEDEMNADITGFNWRERRESVEKFLKSLDQEEVRTFLSENNITYIYWLHGQRATLGETQLGIERIFENEEVDIYKVSKR